MSKREMMLKQIDATLKQEKSYLKQFDKQLSDPSVVGAARERIIMFRNACVDAINRHHKARLKYI